MFISSAIFPVIDLHSSIIFMANKLDHQQVKISIQQINQVC